MKVRVVGIRHVNYISRKTGNSVEGDELHFTFPDRNTNGLCVDKVYISRNSVVPIPPYVPCEGELFFNRYGKVDFATWEATK